jgi:hypothetical protein
MNGCPGLPKEWVRGLETPMKVLSVAEHLLEFREDPPG